MGRGRERARDSKRASEYDGNGARRDNSGEGGLDL